MYIILTKDIFREHMLIVFTQVLLESLLTGLPILHYEKISTLSEIYIANKNECFQHAV